MVLIAPPASVLIYRAMQAKGKVLAKGGQTDNRREQEQQKTHGTTVHVFRLCFNWGGD